MGYMEFITNMMNILVSASTFAQQRNEPELAVINIEAVNKLLPPAFQVKLEKFRPIPTDKKSHNKMYLSKSLDHMMSEWIYYNRALSAVMESISKYAHDQKDQFMAA